MSSRPSISVAIPTYQRIDLLKRAVSSVFSQDYDSWELVVSDGSPQKGETWEYLSKLSSENEKVTVTTKSHPQGQEENTNSALKKSQSDWIKILHDDDVMKPNCLSEMAKITSISESIICVICGSEAHKEKDQKGSRDLPFYSWPLLEIVPKDQIHLGMFLLEDMGGSLPSQKMIHRRVIEHGMLMEETDEFPLLADSWFHARIGQLGDMAIYRKPLVEWHQGHDTLTSSATEEKYDQEFIDFREKIYSLIPDGVEVPSLGVGKQMVRLQRSIWYLRQLRFGRAFELLKDVNKPSAYREFFLWVLHQASKGRYSRINRRVLSW